MRDTGHVKQRCCIIFVSRLLRNETNRQIRMGVGVGGAQNICKAAKHCLFVLTGIVWHLVQLMGWGVRGTVQLNIPS